MARPRSGDGPSATDRMEAAFFEQLRRMPFQKISVSAIVEAAGVNRNSFYYHYADLEELARSAVSNLLISEIPRLIASGFGLESEQIEQVFAGAVVEDRLSRLLVVTGPNSTSELRGILRSALLDLWLEVFRVERADLTTQESATLNFVLGGMIELMSRIEPKDLLSELMTMRTMPILQSSSRIAMETLKAASARVADARPANSGTAG